MKHADSLAYDWWKDPPDTLGKQNNYLLTRAEIMEYRDTLKRLHDAILTEAANATGLLRAMEKKRVMPFERPPVPITVASALEFMLYTGKEKLALTQLLVNATRERKQRMQEAEQAQLRG